MECEYCRLNLSDRAYQTEVYHNFGIIHCSDHASDATRDIHAFMNSAYIVRISDTYHISELKPLFDILRKGIPVMRSNGTLELGWTPYDSYDTGAVIKKIANEWFCPLRSMENEDGYYVHKLVSLNALFSKKPDTLPDHLKNWDSVLQILNTTLKALDVGIYA
jgi:hypothetical protein